jgi:hypothetical protein
MKLNVCKIWCFYHNVENVGCYPLDYIDMRVRYQVITNVLAILLAQDRDTVFE